MRKSILLTRANMRKAKGQMVTIIILMFLAGLMLNLWLMLSTDYKQNFERYHEKLNAQHVTCAVEGNGKELQDFLTQTLEKDAQTDEFILDDCMCVVGSFRYNSGEMTHDFVISEKERALSRRIGRVEIVEEGGLRSGIYLPMLYESDHIKIGKTIDISVGGNKISYKICGFFNSIMTGSHNCAMTEILLTEDKYEELSEMGYAPKSTLCCVRLTDKTESENYETRINNVISGRYPRARVLSNSYLLVRQSRYVAESVCAGVMSMTAFLILLIALVVISSNIINYIGENMKNLGSLKAIGYTSRQIIHSLLLQFLGFSLIAALAGGGFSYALFPYINTMMDSQTGIPYQIRFLPVPFFVTLVVLDGTVAFVVFLSSRRIKKVEPIVALRQGVLTHNFKRNHVPLANTRASLNAALALKTTFSGLKHNITVSITMLVLSLVVAFSGIVVENMLMDSKPLVNLIVGETADSCINVNVDTKRAFYDKMSEDARVEKFYIYHAENVTHVDGLELLATICDDFSMVNNQEIVFEGRYPKYDNEIVIAAKYAKEQGLRIGDEMNLAVGENEAKYIISGFTQISNQLGKDCLLTKDGFERIDELQNISYYLNLADDVDVDDFNSEIKKAFGDKVNMTINSKSVVESGMSVYVSIMTMIVIGILIMSLVVVVFVLYLLVRTILNNKKREYGILKALGFTTGQLILQTALSFMPAVIISLAVGIAVSCAVVNPLLSLFLSGIGIVKCMFDVPVGLISFGGFGILLFMFAIACLLSLRVKRIAPRELLTEI